MLAKTFSATILGIEIHPVEIEINATEGGDNPFTTIVGLPDAAVKESKERVWAALSNSGYCYPTGTTVISLAPSDIKKEGAAFDLPIALGILATAGKIERNYVADIMSVGELSLDGTLRPIKGALSFALSAKSHPDINGLIVPEQNAAEAAIAAGNQLPVYGVKHLQEAVELLSGKSNITRVIPEDFNNFSALNTINCDFSDVKGQTLAKHAIEIAAAGGHNVLMIGPPGSGKSLISKRVPGILPPMTLDEALETTKIHSIKGVLPNNEPLLKQRPFRSPHHTISDAGLIGGQTNPTPGEISLAHNGVLFLDELPEFKKNVLEVLRQPLEDGIVTVSRAAGTFTFPSNFILIAAMNPCPCGFDGSLQRKCRCSSSQINRYKSKISGPLLDRIDIHVEVEALSEDELMSAATGESSEKIRERVIKARKIQEQRFISDKGIYTNADMPPSLMSKHCILDKAGETKLRHSIKELELSARAYDRILRVSRTIADLAGSEKIQSNHIFEAINYRNLDKRLW